MMVRNGFFHRHKWTLTSPFVTPAGFVWPPLWACPCGQMRDVQPMGMWGLQS